jgi:hypothetical protein
VNVFRILALVMVLQLTGCNVVNRDFGQCEADGCTYSESEHRKELRHIDTRVLYWLFVVISYPFLASS